ncbi:MULTISPECIES: DNA cytosine methyltransferase [Mycolicibacter]|uniref:DNA cytosine methyltransferase n=2 Tax=Mycolicibacter TaxID=1073531 RepID=A0ABU5XME3_9MYCO|nr:MULTISPECIES: DNA cytosine methyltransferase [unclassified Mycolicibacter]MEB3023374.1 DNA cytosine methyltransferase [Mycolicibacter sp. MYC098]MEB3033716.1 DNA cytosine methyltransferase [Mycolicibacter sp. MYC340]
MTVLRNLPAPEICPGPPARVLDAFAGPGGWDVGAAIIGMDPASILGVEIDHLAAGAATAAGHRRHIADITSLDPADFPDVTGFICSSPCPTFSAGGLRSGIHDMQIILDVITHAGSQDCTCSWETIAEELGAAADPRTALAAQTIRFGLGLPNLEWLAFEQVPAAEYMFEDIAAELLAQGWEGVDVFTLDAANLGLPVRRNRVFLVANRLRPVCGADHNPSLVRWPQRSIAGVLGWPAGEHVRTRGNRRATGGNMFSADKTGWCLTEKARSWVRESNGERFEAADAGLLQGFPRDYPWQGTRTRQFHQLADVVAPPAAAAVLAAATGARWSAATREYLDALYRTPAPRQAMVS